MSATNILVNLLKALNTGDESKIEFARTAAEVWLAIRFPVTK